MPKQLSIPKPLHSIFRHFEDCAKSNTRRIAAADYLMEVCTENANVNSFVQQLTDFFGIKADKLNIGNGAIWPLIRAVSIGAVVLDYAE